MTTDVTSFDGASWSVFKHDLVGLQRRDLGGGQGDDACGGQAVRSWSVDRRDLRGGQGADFGRRALTWSELRPASAPVVMGRKSAVSSLLSWAVVNAAT